MVFCAFLTSAGYDAELCCVTEMRSLWVSLWHLLTEFFSSAGNNVEVDESLFQDMDDLDLDEDDPDFDPLDLGSDED